MRVRALADQPASLASTLACCGRLVCSSARRAAVTRSPFDFVPFVPCAPLLLSPAHSKEEQQVIDLKKSLEMTEASRVKLASVLLRVMKREGVEMTAATTPLLTTMAGGM